MSLHFVTVSTHSERYLPVLEKQIEDKGGKLIKLGIGQKYEGHFFKDIKLIEYLKTIPKEDIVIFMDGFDSLFLGDIQEIKNKFKESDSELLLSVENIGWLQFIHSTVFEKVKGKYINTGLFMGRAGFLLDFLNDMYSKEYNKKSNQKTWCSYLFELERNNKMDKIKLDNESKIFLNDSFTTNNIVDIKDKRLTVNNKTKPCFIQGNGAMDMSNIINKTGYKKHNIHKDEFWKKKMQYNLTAVFKTYSPILTFYIYLIIIIIFFTGYGLYKFRNIRKRNYFYIGI